MEGARYGRRRKCQYVGVESEPFQSLLVFDTEAMLLVDDDEAELRECDIRTEQPVSADHHVDLPGLEVPQHLRLFLRRLETAQSADVDGKIGKPLAESPCVLFGENRGRHQNDDLPARLHGLERRA